MTKISSISRERLDKVFYCNHRKSSQYFIEDKKPIELRSDEDDK